MEKIKYILFILFLIIGFILIQIYNSKTESEEENYLNNLRFRFSGIVTSKKELYSYTGLFFIDVKASTITNYDVRNVSKFYYCILKNNKAEIIETMDKANVGDSIVVDGFNRKIIVYRNNKKIKQEKIWVSDFQLFYKDIRKMHKL